MTWNLKPVRYFFSSDKKLSRAIHNIFGFYPGNIYLYRLAFLHKSAGSDTVQGIKINNERLEFLGDAILDAVTAEYLFRTFPLKDEGFLTEMRSKLVNRSQLNKLSQKMGLTQLIQLDPDSQNVYRSFHGDAFEALVGAIYMDRGYEFTRRIVLDRIIKRYFNLDDLIQQELNYKSRIIEWAQKERKHISFHLVAEKGSGYRKLYVVEVRLGETAVAQGQDHSIKGAEQNAAEKAWNKLNPDQENRAGA
ncbi:MAG TPA: ribonuclease III [Bacteroidales bacterium]|nr:ribonuclease III [Bacteroidales bacterium]